MLNRKPLSHITNHSHKCQLIEVYYTHLSSLKQLHSAISDLLMGLLLLLPPMLAPPVDMILPPLAALRRVGLTFPMLFFFIGGSLFRGILSIGVRGGGDVAV